jgi:CRISPR/Cas system-associated endonuclease/helicase Cas3
LALIICSAILVYIFKKRSGNAITKNDASPSEEKQFTISFSETEKTLINLLISKSTKNRTISIEEINYVLGVKDKNTGLQKKVRSDTFNDINEKFRFLTQIDQVLIQSKRSEEDKRYFEYYINQENIHILQQFI